jgi:AcrR family transcriptional regulator
MNVPAYEAPEVAPPEPPSSLPRGPHGLPRDLVVRSQRTRMLRALIEVVAEKGYSATTVADIISRAGVSRTTFYQQFKDKEDCFLVAYRKGAEAQYRKVIEAVQSASDPLEQLRNNVRAYLAELIAFPASARAFLLEVAAAGPRAMAIRDEHHLGYVELLAYLYDRFREQRADLPELPSGVFRAAVAAVDDLVLRWIRDGRLGELAKLEPVAVYVELALFGLPEAAGPLPPD